MATVVNTLYPPVIATFQNAFVHTENARVYFTLSSFNSSANIKHVHVSCVNQLNNENALNLSSGLIIQDLHYDDETGLYYANIPVNTIDGNAFGINQFYKVQIRFDSYAGTDVPINEESAKNEYLLSHTQYFSEWSSVCLIRPISQPKIVLPLFDAYEAEQKTPAFNKGLFQLSGGLVFGKTKMDGDKENFVITSEETETLQAYTVSILDSDKKVIISSPTIYTGENLNQNEIVYNIDLSSLKNSNDTGASTDSAYYIMRVTARTKNQYQLSRDCRFQISEYAGVDEWKPTITAQTDDETASVTVTVKNEYSFSDGVSVYVRRASNADNFKEWETIYSSKLQDIDFTFTDNTVNSLTWYRYRVEGFSNTGMQLSKPTMSQIVFPQFYDAYIYRDGKQFAIRYNYKIANFKPVVNRTKIDTLGSKYPRFAENAILNYKQFSISGIISAESDVYSEFANKAELIYHDSDTLKDLYSEYKDDYDVKDLVRNDFKNFSKETGVQYPESPIPSITSQRFLTTTTNDWLYEREFRESLVSWLNDGEPKLYRSMTEGSMVVMVTDVSLTPNSQLSRRLWDFSATVYEVEDASSLETLDTLGIYNRTMIESINGDSAGSDEDDDDNKDFIEVIQPGQLYKTTIAATTTAGGATDSGASYNIINNISDELNKKYSGILSNSKADAIVLKNVKIYYHSKPSRYVFDTNGGLNIPIKIEANPEAGKEDFDDVTANYMRTEGKIQLGYVFSMKTKTSSGKNTSIFVNDRGYYQIPDNIDVEALYFQPSDIVTLEYTVCYKKKNSSKQSISGASIDRTVVGQEAKTFQPNDYLGDDIRAKYTYVNIKDNVIQTTQKMNYWKGISLDVTPFAVAKIKYHNQDDYHTYVVGESGVLYLLKNVEIDDMCFLGIRMKKTNKTKYLQENEFKLDSSVTEQDIHDFDVSNYSGTDADEDIQIENPEINTVYKIDNQLKIYYNYSWYDFYFVQPDGITGNDNATPTVGIAAIPVDGMINYYGTVMTTNYQ